MTSHINALNAAIYSKLSGGTALVSALGGTCIYHGIAPEGKALPFVIWSYVAGGHENMTPRESVNAVVYVRAYAVDAKTAAQLDGYAAELLETKLTVTGWNNFWLAREESIVLPSIDEAGKSTWSCGAYYRVRLD
jgi:hypothetical protein